MINVIGLSITDPNGENINLILPLEDNLIREDVDTIEELGQKWKKSIGYQNNFKFEDLIIRKVFETNEEKEQFLLNLPNLFADSALAKNTEIIKLVPVVIQSDQTVICECLDFYIFSSLAILTMVKYSPWDEEEHEIITCHPEVAKYYVGGGNNPQSDEFFECSVCNSIIASDDGYSHNYRERAYNNTPIWETTPDDEDDTDWWNELQYTCTKCKEKEDAKNGMNESIINGYLRGYFNVTSSLGYERHDSYYIKQRYPHYSHKKLIEDAKSLDTRFLLMLEYEHLSIAGNEGHVNLLKKRKPIEKEPDAESYGFHSQSGFDDQPSGWMIEGAEEIYYEDLRYYKQQQKEKSNETS